MRTLGSEAGRSEERAARGPTFGAISRALVARRQHGASTCMRAARVVWFLWCGEDVFQLESVGRRADRCESVP